MKEIEPALIGIAALVAIVILSITQSFMLLTAFCFVYLLGFTVNIHRIRKMMRQYDWLDTWFAPCLAFIFCWCWYLICAFDKF